ncbi:hypothetical protein vseg_007124 [Gypsophila vaccaria]
MVDVSETRLIEQINEVGNKLLLPPKSTHELLDLLDEVELILTKVGQAPSHLVQVALLIPMKALIADELFTHSDPNVRITVASCLNEVTRITAPIPPFEDDKMREFFELLVTSFENLSCQPGRCYSKAVLILQSVARLRSCVMLLDLDCDPLVTKLFEVFQKNISLNHPQVVLLSMVDIISVIVQESDFVSLELLKALLASIKIENQSVMPASWELGAKILERCADKLRSFIMEVVSSMCCCLEDFAPILSSICDPKPDSVTKAINKPSGKLSHAAEYVQALNVTESFGCVAVLGIGGISSKREGDWDSPNLSNEAFGPYQANNEPSGNPSHRAEYVQALEASESFECVSAQGTGGTATKRLRKQTSQNLDEDVTGLHQVNSESSGNSSHPSEFVQALEVPESVECVNVLGTGDSISKRGGKSNSQNIDKEGSVFESEHGLLGTPNDDVVGKDVTFKKANEEAVGFENSQADLPSELGNVRRKRGRPRKNEVTGTSGSCGPESCVKKLPKQHEFSGNEALEASESFECINARGTASKRRRRQNSQDLDEDVTGLHQVNNESSSNLSHPSDFVQASEAPDSSGCVNVLVTGDSASKGRGKPNLQNINEEASALEHENDHPGNPNDDVFRKDVAFEKLKEEAVDFENKQSDLPSALGNVRRKRGRPRKNEVTGASGSCGSGSSGKKLPKQPEFSKTKASEIRHGGKNYGDNMVGCRIKVWWPLDDSYYEGTVTMFDASLRKHTVNYDDGDAEVLNLRKERWTFIGNDTPIDIALDADKVTS